MNSTPAEPANTPLIPDLLVTTVIAWLGVAFCSLSCVVISYKAFQEYNRLRFGCVVLGALVLILCVVNTQRIWGNVTDDQYLTGMGVLLLLHIIAVLIVIPYPPEYKELNIIESSFATALRSGLLGFYSFPPSATVILAVRRRFHRDSLNDKHLGPGIRLPDNDSNV
ncbi:hypothetical protein BC938DRAFT_473127 [Jimgerdemannia flammicorona]|uniref:Uncharacterized protein n=1 Tax=Jimgerdemannia flammicorona TaxID=994334 RepID=A0A433Q4K4_9FUNG|nr:hypothetical protein BC938DRAFT_473127 [Jimgerdemannia flammicorona]